MTDAAKPPSVGSITKSASPTGSEKNNEKGAVTASFSLSFHAFPDSKYSPRAASGSRFRA
ncbi:hypothetical protein M8756_01595 [Lutimaribacter sp. EGI FJ00015]|nr:hypothetical protein [Lutimaribacter sp. EGI FJ00015]